MTLPFQVASKSKDFYKALKFPLCCTTLKAEQLDAIICIHDGKDVFLWLPTRFGKSICYKTLPLVFNYNRQWLQRSPCHVTSCVSGKPSPQNNHV